MSEFKTTGGRWITVGLFKETAGPYKEGVRWTLEEAKQLFLETNDPTGWTFANEHLGGYQHWLALRHAKGLEDILKEWDTEIEVKLRYLGLKNVIKSAKGGHYQASKFLVDKGWDVRTAGRPSNEEVDHERKVQAKIKDSFLADVKHIKRD